MRIEFPEDKRTGFDHNILHCAKLKFLCAKEHFQIDEDLIGNTAICNDIAFEYRKNTAQQINTIESTDSFYTNNTQIPYSPL